jgi:hypothetical protein
MVKKGGAEEMSIIDEDNRLVYDLAFTSKEINIIVDALHHHYKKPSPHFVEKSEELKDIIHKLEWCFHGPGRRPE